MLLLLVLVNLCVSLPICLDATLDHEVCLAFHVELYCELEAVGGGGVDILLRLRQPEMLPHEVLN